MVPYQPKKAMVIMAHPDDPEFFCGGLIAQWAKNGTEIAYLILSNGNKGSDDPLMTPDRLVEIRKTEQQKAADVLGVKHIIYLNENDGELLPTLEIRRRVVKEIRRFQPDAAITCDPTRFFFENTYINHPDHRAAGEIALNALFPATGNRMYCPELLALGLYPHTVAHIFLAGATEVTMWVDITEVIDLKVKAFLCHKSQISEPEALSSWLRKEARAIDKHGREVYREGFRHMIIG